MLGVTGTRMRLVDRGPGEVHSKTEKEVKEEKDKEAKVT